MLVLAGYALLQTVSLGKGSTAGVAYPFWNAISADPYSTRFFVLQLLALTAAGALFYRYASTPGRINTTIHVIIALAVASALFGIARQTMQHQVGFGLPLIKPNQGYGQFINKNHFAFLMEMGLGLALGLIIAGGIKREKAMIYFAALLPIWTALVLSNSRGGLLAMLAQLVIAVLLCPLAVPASTVQSTGVLRLAGSLPARILLVTVLVIGVLIGTVWVGGDRLVSSIQSVRSEFNASEAAPHQGASRNDIWRATLRMFSAHPIAGVGLSGYWIAITAYHDASGTLTPQEAHNEYLELLVSGGLLGFAIGVWFAIEVLRRLKNNLASSDRFRRTTAFAATLGIAGVAVHSLVDFGLHMLVNALCFMALLSIATGFIDYNSRPKESDG
jgi:O-antigen ligase